ncbi:MAG: alpha/beta hydrolase [Oscillospiraceae bacterium]|nr:alpha/beta hydrolase [Oscillospiraceae bacterium]MBQ5712490.1 alpha/beta hydrolase [Oscillospiraceae bacterium]
MVVKWNVMIPRLTGEKERCAYIYLPDSYETEPEKRYPVMYMFDGHNVFFDEDATYGKSWGMGEYLQKTGKELIVVAVEADPEGNGRLYEYSPFDYENSEIGKVKGKGATYMKWLVKELKPYIDEHYRTLPDRTNTIIAGSSLGGLMALFAVTVHNDVFQRGACLSPSLWVAPGQVLEMVARSKVKNDTCIYMDYGSLEIFNHAANAESLISTGHLLLTKRVNLAFRIVPGGTHSEASWEQQIPIFMDCLGI